MSLRNSMKLTELHKLDFRWIVASLPVIIIMAGLGATPPPSVTVSQSGSQDLPTQELTTTSNENCDQSPQSRSLSGMAGESQPATIPRANWTAASYCFGKDQSRKNRFSVGSTSALSLLEQSLISPKCEKTSLGRVSDLLSRRFTLVGLKPSGTS